MFRSRQKNNAQIGSNYDMCQHKRVELERDPDRPEIVIGAQLHCIRTEDEGLVIETPARVLAESAYARLADTAGRLVCGSCTYACMTPVEAAERRALNAEDAVKVAEYEYRRLYAQEHLRMIQGDIVELTAGSDDIQAALDRPAS